MCSGKGTVLYEVRVATMNSGGYADICYEVPACSGYGRVAVERCESCQQSEANCLCNELPLHHAPLQNLEEAWDEPRTAINFSHGDPYLPGGISDSDPYFDWPSVHDEDY